MWPPRVRSRVSRQLTAVTCPTVPSTSIQSPTAMDPQACNDMPASRLPSTPCMAKPMTPVMMAVEVSSTAMLKSSRYLISMKATPSMSARRSRLRVSRLSGQARRICTKLSTSSPSTSRTRA